MGGNHNDCLLQTKRLPAHANNLGLRVEPTYLLNAPLVLFAKFHSDKYLCIRGNLAFERVRLVMPKPRH